MYLLSILGLSFMIPALSIPFYEVNVTPLNMSYVPIANSTFDTSNVPVNQRIEFMTVLSTIYLIVTLFFLIKLIIEFSSIIKIINSSPNHKKQFFTEVYVGGKLPLSSFFRYLLIPNPDKLSSLEYQHELAHIKQHHSIDKLLIGICNAVLWFNPIVYFMRKSFNELHEYLADEEVINQNNKTVYLNFLRNTVTKQYGFSTLNPFYSLIKNRLTMINNETKSSRKIILFVLPICVALFGVFACEEYITSEEQDSIDKTFSNEFVFQENSVPDLETTLSLTGLFDRNKDCKCLGINLLYAAKGKDIVRVINPGSTFNEASQLLIKKSKAGDKFLLDNIKLDCQDSYLHANQIIISVESSESPNLSHITFNDTITYFNEDTYEETVKIIEQTVTQQEYNLMMLREETEVTTADVENFYNKTKGKINLDKDKTPVSSPTKNHLNVNGQSREYTIVERENTDEKNYLLSNDTITIFDEDTYEETVRIISNYTTKEIYDAYQDAKAKELYIYLREQKSDERFGGQVHYEDVSKYLKANASFLLEKNKTYVYEILERGKVKETSAPFKLSDL